MVNWEYKKTYSHIEATAIYNTIFISNLQCSQHMEMKPEEVTALIIIALMSLPYSGSQKSKYFLQIQTGK